MENVVFNSEYDKLPELTEDEIRKFQALISEVEKRSGKPTEIRIRQIGFYQPLHVNDFRDRAFRLVLDGDKHEEEYVECDGHTVNVERGHLLSSEFKELEGDYTNHTHFHKVCAEFLEKKKYPNGRENGCNKRREAMRFYCSSPEKAHELLDDFFASNDPESFLNTHLESLELIGLVMQRYQREHHKRGDCIVAWHNFYQKMENTNWFISVRVNYESMSVSYASGSISLSFKFGKIQFLG